MTTQDNNVHEMPKRLATPDRDEAFQVKGSKGSNAFHVRGSNGSAVISYTGSQDTFERSRNSIVYKDSIFTSISQHWLFENLTMAVIVLNALWIGVDTEWNHAALRGFTWKSEGVVWALNVTGFDPLPVTDADVVEQHRNHIREQDDAYNTVIKVKDEGYIEQNGPLPLEPYSIFIENAFCAYFSIELTFRFLSYAEKWMGLHDAWFIFDTILVFCMALETWLLPAIFLVVGGGGGSALAALSPFRLLRLLRLTRMARLMRFVPELLTLVMGMIRAATSVGFIFVFLILVMYVFAILFTAQMEDREEYPLTPYCAAEGENKTDGCLGIGEFGETGPDMFATMGDSFLSLFTRGVLADNLDETVNEILKSNQFLMWMFMIFLIITFATLLNMLIGVLCSVVSDTAIEEQAAATVNSLRGTIEEAFKGIDQNGDGMISENEWSKIATESPKVRQSLKSIMEAGIDDQQLAARLDQMKEMLFNWVDDEEPSSQGLASQASGALKTQTSNQSFEAQTSEERREGGLSIQDLIDKIVDIRPDQNASALDVRLLKVQVKKDQQNVKKRLKKIENGLKTILGPAANHVDLNVADEAARTLRPNSGVKDPNSMNMANSLPGMTPSNTVTANGVNLTDVPTQVLFQALKSRSPPNPGAN